jgi:predicted membrane protein
MSIIFTHDKHWWALIPGSIIGLVGLSVLFGGVFMNILEWFGYLWPIALIAAGLFILWRIRHPKEEKSEAVEKTA